MTDYDLKRALRLARLPASVPTPGPETDGLDTDELMAVFQRALAFISSVRSTHMTARRDVETWMAANSSSGDKSPMWEHFQATLREWNRVARLLDEGAP